MEVFFRAMREGGFALWSHFWAALDIARTAWGGKPLELVDLLAGGKRKGLLESADTFYAIGFINIQRGFVYQLEIPLVGNFYTVVSLHSSHQQSSVEYFTDSGKKEQAGVVSVLLADGLDQSEGLSASAYLGPTQLMVRQYFWNTEGVDGPKIPRLERLEPPVLTASNGRFRAGILAGMRFLGWRLKMLLGMKYIQFRMKQAEQVNQFYSQEEVVSLWTKVTTSISRLGITRFRYLLCMYNIQDDEVLRIDYQPKEGRYFAFCLHNNWMQRINVIEETGHLNSSQLRKGVDGNYTVHVGSRNDGYENFLNIGGYRSGVIAFREISSSNEEEVPKCRIISWGVGRR